MGNQSRLRRKVQKYIFRRNLFNSTFFLIQVLITFQLYGDGFCTTLNLKNYCGVNSIEYKIDSGKISPALNCSKIFLWIPPVSTGEEKCYICADNNSQTQLAALFQKPSTKKCGKIILAGKKL
jgi:hypothetical protein